MPLISVPQEDLAKSSDLLAEELEAIKAEEARFRDLVDAASRNLSGWHQVQDQRRSKEYAIELARRRELGS